jgi:hypothetical protein
MFVVPTFIVIQTSCKYSTEQVMSWGNAEGTYISQDAHAKLKLIYAAFIFLFIGRMYFRSVEGELRKTILYIFVTT